MNWDRSGSTGARTLDAAWKQIHWLLQPAAAYALAAIPAQPDWSHYALRWDPEGRSFQTADGRVIVNPATALVQVDGQVLTAGGRRLEEVYSWVSEVTGQADLGQHPPPHEMPDHAIQSGAAFNLDPAASREVAHWYGNAFGVLSSVGGEILVWPHHFDIATIAFRDGEKQVGCGMVPADSSYDQPYWYVTPWPYPDAHKLPELGYGHWHTDGWTGAVLTASEMISASDQEAAVSAFLERALVANRALVEGG
jgi:hypothetical protein